MSDLGTFQKGLIDWTSKYAAHDLSTTLPAGAVNWFNRQRPFVSPDLSAGLYCRLISFVSPGRPNRTRQVVTRHGVEYVQTTYSANDKVRFQVQAVSFNDSDEDSALVWLNNLSNRCRFDESHQDLLKFGVSIINKADIQLFSSRLDDREPTVGSFELLLHLHSDVLGSDVPFIRSIQGTGKIENPADVPDQPFKV